MRRSTVRRALYTSLTLFDDAIEAREFAYRDVLASFRRFRALAGDRRPFILVGVEQGGVLAARLLRDEIAPDADLSRRLVAAYLIETAVPATDHEPPGASTPSCATATQTGVSSRLDLGRPTGLRPRDTHPPAGAGVGR